MCSCSARTFTASRKSILSISWTNVKTFHHFQHPKHLKICFVGETINDGVFSQWNGQHAEKLLPALLRGIYLEITSTISTRPNTSSTREFTIQTFLNNLKILSSWFIVIFYLFFKWEKMLSFPNFCSIPNSVWITPIFIFSLRIIYIISSI